MNRRVLVVLSIVSVFVLSVTTPSVLAQSNGDVPNVSTSGLDAFVLRNNNLDRVTMNRQDILQGSFEPVSVKGDSYVTMYVVENGKPVNGTIRLNFIPSFSSDSGDGGRMSPMMLMMMMEGNGNMDMSKMLMMQQMMGGDGGNMDQRTMALMMMESGIGEGFGYSVSKEVKNGMAFVPIMKVGTMALGEVKASGKTKSFFINIGEPQDTGSDIEVKTVTPPVTTIKKNQQNTIEVSRQGGGDVEVGEIQIIGPGGRILASNTGSNSIRFNPGGTDGIFEVRVFDPDGNGIANESLRTEGYSPSDGEDGSSSQYLAVGVIVIAVAIVAVLNHKGYIDLFGSSGNSGPSKSDKEDLWE